MNILIMTIPVSITLVILFIMFFLAAVKDGQFDDLETPAHCPLLDDMQNSKEAQGELKNG